MDGQLLHIALYNEEKSMKVCYGKSTRALLSEMLAFGTKEGLVMYVTVTDRHLLCSWKFYRMQDEKQSLLQEKER